MVSAPVNSAPVNDPKNVGIPGSQVRMMAPRKSGTIIMPPGIRSIVRLIGSWTMAGLAGRGKRADLLTRHGAPRRETLQAAPLLPQLVEPDAERHQEHRDRQGDHAGPAGARVCPTGGADPGRAA